MGKDNKKRRALKRAKREKRARLRRRLGNKTRALSPVLEEIPNPFRNLTESERLKVIADKASRSQEEHKSLLKKLMSMLHSYDPLTLISLLTFYGLTVPISERGIEKTDSEFIVHQAHIELFQALALKVDSKSINQNPFGPEVVQQLMELLPSLMTAQRFRNFGRIDSEQSEEEKAVSLLQEQIRGNTQMVRNWGYFSQVVSVASELYAPLDELISEKHGFTISNVVELFTCLAQELEGRAQTRIVAFQKLYQVKDKKKIVYRYYEQFGYPEKDAELFISSINLRSVTRKNLVSMLFAHSDLNIVEYYLFSIEDLANTLNMDTSTLSKIVDTYSKELGSLQGLEVDQIFLSNPIWQNPLVKLDEKVFYAAIPQLFFSFLFPSLDKLIDPEDKAVLSSTRSEYLESKIADVIKTRFPAAKTISGVEWSVEGKVFETDLITFIDSHAIIVEAKSGRVTGSALRGAPDRAKRHIEEIFIAPNVQSKRLKDRLVHLIENPSESDSSLRSLPVDLSSIHKIIRVSVSLEDFAMIQSNLVQLKDTGWLPEDFEPCPTMNLADFETLFDLLEHPVQLIHYLEVRQELEARLGYMADELDLLGLYMDTLFNLGDIESDISFVLTGYSSAIDNYYNSKDAGVDLSKPKPKVGEMFSRIFEQLEERQSDRWTEIGVILNRFSPDDQRIIQSKVNKLKRNVEKRWNIEGHKNMLVYVPPKASQYSLVYFLYNNKNSHRTKDFQEAAAANGLEPDHVANCLVIGRNIDDESMAYHFIGLFSKR